MSGRTKQRVPLDLFLSGMLALEEKDHPVIVVDETKQHRRFPGHRQWSGRSANSSFCSSVTSCSFGTSNSQTAALCASRWESMPRKKGGDTTLRAPARDSNLCLKRPSRTRTNDLTLKKTVASKKPIRPLPKRNSFRNPIRRIKSTSSSHCSKKSRENRAVVATKIHASI